MIQNGFTKEKAAHVKDCILTHRYRSDNPPASIEAKILFDADKLDVIGAIGIARTLQYNAIVSEPLYSIGEGGVVLDGSNDEEPSFSQEYKYKLENLYDKFFTIRANQIAMERQVSANAFYLSMLKEVRESYQNGLKVLNTSLED